MVSGGGWKKNVALNLCADGAKRDMEKVFRDGAFKKKKKKERRKNCVKDDVSMIQIDMETKVCTQYGKIEI